MEDLFLIDQEDIDELKRIAEQLRSERPELARSLEEMARAAQGRRVMDDTCY